MVDVFEEVEGDLRVERWKRFARRYLPWAVLGLVVGLAVAGGLFGWREYQRRGAEQASTDYAQALEMFNRGDLAGAEIRYRRVAEGRSAAYKSLALMQIGGLRLSANKPADAATLFDQAAEAAPHPVLEDAARIKAVFARMDAQPYAASIAELEPLTAEGRPYRLMAREALALARVGAGQLQAARSDLSGLSISPEAPQGLKARAVALTALIDSGAAASLPAVAKAAAALPPVQPGPPGAGLDGLALPPGVTP